MTTAQAIEGITDAGQFEILATRVLRLVDDDCKYLEHMGVNAEGKTITNPVDGFCMVPGTDPPRFVMVAFTTDKIENLERKWLFDHSTALRAKKATAANDGDLIKASQRAQTLRKTHSNATFVVHLCTNKQPNDTLMADVLACGKKLGIDVRFLGRSRIRDELDTTRDGQWLRKQHLGIQAERLSLPLFHELARQSLERYGREFLITPPTAFIPTTSERALANEVTSRRSVYLVTGASGTGKSVSCFQLLRSHLASDGIGLWIPGEVAARASSLEEVIGDTLRTLHPMIEPTAGADALALAGGTQHLLLVIDDIIRSGSPTETLRKLLAWLRPSKQNQDVTTPHSIVVPVWDLFWAPLEPQFRAAGWLASVPTNKMEECEACACLVTALGPRVQQFAEVDQVNIVRALGNDPILIALYADSVNDQECMSAPLLALEVVGRFLQSAQADAAASGTCLQADYEPALVALADWMLSNRALYPRWRDINEALPENVIKPLRELARIGKICRISDRAGEDRFEFRHDRILEHYLARSLQRMLASFEANEQVISDPFYASFVGLALATSSPSDGLVRWLERNSPLSLFAAIRFLPPQPHGSDHVVVTSAIRWLKEANQSSATPSDLLIEAYRILEETDSPCVLDITDHLHGSWFKRRARLANGSADEIIVEFANSRFFAPGSNDPGLDSVFSRALHRHSANLIKECSALLESGDTTDDRRQGALVLAGFIGHPSLGAAVRVGWRSMTDKVSAILSALWAGIRCGESDPSGILGPIVDAWAQLPDDRTDGGLSDRVVIGDSLRFAIRRGSPAASCMYLITAARTVEALRWPITLALKDSDDPIAITFLLEEAAEIEQRLKGTNQFSHLLMSLKDQWDPTTGRGRRLPQDCIRAIRTCWESETSGPQLRETAFKIWVRATDDLKLLRAISASHPQFETVLWRRAQLGDISTVQEILPILQGDSDWFRIVNHVWCAPLQPVLDLALADLAKHTPDNCLGGATNEHYMLAELIRDIPVADGEPLLLKHWGHLQFSRLFVQTAMYIGSSECIAKAEAAVARYPKEVDPFEHIDMFFGFFVTGLMDRLEHHHLVGLLPYLPKLSDLALSDMARYCQRQGKHKWANTHLKPEFDRRRARLPAAAKEKQEHAARIGRHHFPSDDDLRENLDWIEQQGNHYYWHVSRWSEEFDERQDDHSRWCRLLQEWLAEGPAIGRFKVVAAAVLQHGTRADLELLNNRFVKGDQVEIEKIRANATFGVMRRSIR